MTMDDDLGQGTLHELSDNAEAQKSRLWKLKSTSEAACLAADKRPEPKARKVGFFARRPK